MKKKIKSIIVWTLLAIAGAWIIIIANIVLYLQVGFERLSLTAAALFFLAVLCLVVKAIHILGSHILSVKSGGTGKCHAG